MLARFRSHRFQFLLVLLLAAVAPVAVAQDDDGGDDDLEALLEQVGSAYAEAYVAPIANAFGANQNTSLFNTADIPARFSITFGIKAMGAQMSEDDKSFRKVIQVDNVYDYVDMPGNPAPAAGYIVMEGPTAIGADEDGDEGSVTGYVNGLPVATNETIAGLVDTRWVPLAAPEVAVGMMGARLTLRWLPEIDAGDYGKTSYFGWGLQYNPKQFLPPLPVDVSVGFFKQAIDVGSIVETDAHSLFLAASKSFGLATLYTGLATESATMDVTYTYEGSDGILGNADDATVSFEVDSIMKKRFTLGATLNLGLKLYAEGNWGDLTVYSTGLLIGF